MNVRLKYSTAFTAGVFYDSQLLMNNYKLIIEFTTISDDSRDQNIALDRIRYFVQHQLESSVFINGNNREQCELLSRAGVRLTTLPEEPVDQVVGIMLHCKLNAIAENRMIITETEIASELGENITYMHDDNEQLGPLSAVGWWRDSNSSHCDHQLISTDKVVAMNFDRSWRELNLQWQKENAVIEVDSDNKLVFADFQKDDSR
jgi:hypothetical protein